MNKYCLFEGVVQYLYTLVYTQKLERCGILYVGNHKDGIDYLYYDPKREHIGIEEDGRQRCDSEDYHHIVHTHPLSEYPYPSWEDIFRLVKEPAIKLSVIATTWGIYTLKQKGKGLDFLNDMIKNNKEPILKKWLKDELDNIGKLQDIKKQRDIDDNTLTKKENNLIDSVLHNINKHIDIEITLYTWQSIKFSHP